MTTYVLKHIQGTDYYLGRDGNIVQGIENARVFESGGDAIYVREQRAARFNWIIKKMGES